MSPTRLSDFNKLTRNYQYHITIKVTVYREREACKHLYICPCIRVFENAICPAKRLFSDRSMTIKLLGNDYFLVMYPSEDSQVKDMLKTHGFSNNPLSFDLGDFGIF